MNDNLTRRETVGPFILLGTDKDASDAELDAQWEEQRRAVEVGDVQWRAEDVDWARAQLTDPEGRLAADADSPNADIASGELRRLSRTYHLDSTVGWDPIDPEPPVQLPGSPTLDPQTVTANLPAPEVPMDLPAINEWLDRFAAAALDPWGVELNG